MIQIRIIISVVLKGIGTTPWDVSDTWGTFFGWQNSRCWPLLVLNGRGPGVLIIQPQVSYSSVKMNRPVFRLTVEYSHQIGMKVENTADNQLSVDPKSFPMCIL